MRKRFVVLTSLLLLAVVVCSPSCVAQATSSNWRAKLRQELPLLGHRNWILIVDAAYPLQISPGIETIETGADQLAVTQGVLATLNHTIHVRPVVYLDAELPYVSVEDYAGVTAYRDGLKKALKPYPVQTLLHAEILDKLNEAGKTYKILVLKTTMTVPYTSVFLQLDCKYLSEEGERKLRQAMKAGAMR